MKACSIVAGVCLAALGALAQTPGASSPPDRLPQEKHDGLAVSVDAYTRFARAKDKFGKANPLAVGILPVEVFFQNDANLPVKLDLNTIQLEIKSGEGQHQDLDWLSPAQVAESVAHPDGPPPPKMRRFPIGGDVAQDKKRDKMLEILEPLALDSDIVPPKGTLHGFLFFNVSGEIPSPGDASLYIPDLSVATSHAALMFFEVALAGSGLTTP